MSGFPIVDLVVGLIFIYFILSIICSSIVEMVMSFFKLRAEILTKWLTTIFDKIILQPDNTQLKLGQAIADHCATTALSKPGKSTSYIDGKNFSTALIEKMTFLKENTLNVAKDLDVIIKSLETAKAVDGTSMLSTDLQRTFLMFSNEARAEFNTVAGKVDSELHLFKEKIEKWFDSNMDRISGKLKTKYARPANLLCCFIGNTICKC